MNYTIKMNGDQVDIVARALELFAHIGVGRLEYLIKEISNMSHPRRDVNYSEAETVIIALKQIFFPDYPAANFTVSDKKVDVAYLEAWNICNNLKYCRCLEANLARGRCSPPTKLVLDYPPVKVEQDKNNYMLKMQDTQVDIILRALELLSRVGIGQLEYVFEEIRFHAVISSTTAGDYAKIDADRRKAEALVAQLKNSIFGQPLNGSFSICNEEVDVVSREAWDILQVLRHRRAWDRNPKGEIWNVSYDKPIKWVHGYPTVEIVRNDREMNDHLDPNRSEVI